MHALDAAEMQYYGLQPLAVVGTTSFKCGLYTRDTNVYWGVSFFDGMHRQSATQLDQETLGRLGHAFASATLGNIGICPFKPNGYATYLSQLKICPGEDVVRFEFQYKSLINHQVQTHGFYMVYSKDDLQVFTKAMKGLLVEQQ